MRAKKGSVTNENHLSPTPFLGGSAGEGQEHGHGALLDLQQQAVRRFTHLLFKRLQVRGGVVIDRHDDLPLLQAALAALAVGAHVQDLHTLHLAG